MICHPLYCRASLVCSPIARNATTSSPEYISLEVQLTVQIFISVYHCRLVL